MSTTKIEWCEKVWNPVTGCTKVSTGCKNCYAERLFRRVYSGRKFTDVQCHPERLDQPLHWRKPRMVFVNSMSDLFHEKILTDFVESVWQIMERCPQHVFQILTKRPYDMMEVLDTTIYRGTEDRNDITANVWLGVSVENQETAAERIPLLLQTPAAVRFVSCEPLLNWVVFNKADMEHIDWVICGGESGPRCRPMELKWAYLIKQMCKNTKTPFFMKQLGGWPDKRSKLEDLPPDLRIREYPKGEK
jgi:protein gp37